MAQLSSKHNSTSAFVIIQAKKAESSPKEDESSTEDNTRVHSVGENGLSPLSVTVSGERWNGPCWAIPTSSSEFFLSQFLP